MKTLSLHWRVLLPLYLLLSVTTKTIIGLLNQAFVFPMEKLYTWNQLQHLGYLSDMWKEICDISFFQYHWISWSSKVKHPCKVHLKKNLHCCQLLPTSSQLQEMCHALQKPPAPLHFVVEAEQLWWLLKLPLVLSFFSCWLVCSFTYAPRLVFSCSLYQ